MAALASWAADIPVKIQGLQANDRATVSLGSDTFLATKSVDASVSEIAFTDVAAGKYFVKIEAAGYNLPQSQTVIVNPDGTIEPVVGLSLVVTPQEADPDTFHHSWEQDQSQSGYTTTSNVNKPAEVEFLGKMVVPSDVPSMSLLYNDYHILLCDEGEPWTQEYAYRLLETMKTIETNPYGSHDAPYSKFILTSGSINDDIAIEKSGDCQIVTLSKDAFIYANPFLVNLDGVRGRFFSKRLHHALVNFYTDMGANEWMVNEILNKRYGCQILDVDYAALTAGITDETGQSFQQFRPSERVAIINMLEELPEGFHSTPHLNYLIRRKDGVQHPIYPGAAAVSWCVDNGYIEFMEKAFGGNNVGFDTQRLILHEKTHFLWAFTFSDEIKDDWTQLGGWYKGPNADSGWSTTKDTESVSAYAHQHNPDEDMAESVAFYLKDPEKLTAVANEKYEFIRDRIMHGTRYISHIPDHLTFEVLNLFPDYDFPGKIRRLDVKAEGAPEANKRVTIEVELQHLDGFQDGANTMFTRILSPAFKDDAGNPQQHYRDVYLYQVDGNDHLFRGEVEISNYSKAGYWYVRDLQVRDQNGLARYEGRNDCVWNLYVNNPLEDLVTPKYVDNSLEYILTDTIIEGAPSQNLEVRVQATDEHLSNAILRLVNDVQGSAYGDRWGDAIPGTNTFSINYPIPNYFPTSDYYLNFVDMYDEAGNVCRVEFFREDIYGPQKKIHITTSNPDTKAPVIDLDRITVYAEPTHPEAPDGETKVTIHFYCKDDISGELVGMYTLRDPQGTDHRDWMYISCGDEAYFLGDVTAWRHKVVNVMLPQGSAPGIWGVAALEIQDKALNNYIYNFVETMIFEPDNDLSNYVLFAEMDEDMLHLYMDTDDPAAVKFGWRVIHEETGMEINSYDQAAARRGVRRAQADGFDMRVDLSEYPVGDYVAIVTAMDEAGQPLSVKSARVTKGNSAVGCAEITSMGFSVTPGAGTMTFTSSINTIIPVYDLLGRKVASVAVAPGVRTVSIAPGVYVVSGQKVLVR